MPVIFIPLLGLAALALAIWPRERFLLPVAAFSVVTLAATLLAVGAGEAFKEDREREMPGGADQPDAAGPRGRGPRAAAHDDPADVTLVGSCSPSPPAAAAIVLRVLIVLLAATAVFFVIRTGHLGAKLAWGPRARAGRPLGSRASRRGSAARRGTRR